MTGEKQNGETDACRDVGDVRAESPDSVKMTSSASEAEADSAMSQVQCNIETIFMKDHITDKLGRHIFTWPLWVVVLHEYTYILILPIVASSPVLPSEVFHELFFYQFICRMVEVMMRVVTESNKVRVKMCEVWRYSAQIQTNVSFYFKQSAYKEYMQKEG